MAGEGVQDRSKVWTFRPIDKANAHSLLNWQYETPYDLYNLHPDDADGTVRVMLDPKNMYHVLADEKGNLVAYCCFGPDAQVPGGDYRLPALDIGLGVRPDLTGRGDGLTYVHAVLEFALRTFGPVAFRITVAEFNKRALRVWEKAGFRPVQRFRKVSDGLPFVILMQQATGSTPHGGYP